MKTACEMAAATEDQLSFVASKRDRTRHGATHRASIVQSSGESAAMSDQFRWFTDGRKYQARRGGGVSGSAGDATTWR